jgi:hypothetical protein
VDIDDGPQRNDVLKKEVMCVCGGGGGVLEEKVHGIGPKASPYTVGRAWSNHFSTAKDAKRSNTHKIFFSGVKLQPEPNGGYQKKSPIMVLLCVVHSPRLAPSGRLLRPQAKPLMLSDRTRIPPSLCFITNIHLVTVHVVQR